jgi:hypothetical protein
MLLVDTEREDDAVTSDAFEVNGTGRRRRRRSGAWNKNE